MNTKKSTAIVGALALLNVALGVTTVPTPASADSNSYLKVNGVPGESTKSTNIKSVIPKGTAIKSVQIKPWKGASNQSKIKSNQSKNSTQVKTINL